MALLHYYQAREWRHLRLLERNSMCYSPLPPLVHWSMCTVYHCTTNLPGKERGNYTHNFVCKSTKRDVSDKVLSSWNFVLIRYPTDTGANKWYRSYFPLNLINLFQVLATNLEYTYPHSVHSYQAQLEGFKHGFAFTMYTYVDIQRRVDFNLYKPTLTQRQYMYTCIRI